MTIASSGDIVSAGGRSVRVTVALADNTAKTLCAVPTGKVVKDIFIREFIGESSSRIVSYNVALTSNVVITPQITSNLSGTADIEVVFMD